MSTNWIMQNVWSQEKTSRIICYIFIHFLLHLDTNYANSFVAKSWPNQCQAKTWSKISYRKRKIKISSIKLWNQWSDSADPAEKHSRREQWRPSREAAQIQNKRTCLQSYYDSQCNNCCACSKYLHDVLSSFRSSKMTSYSLSTNTR